MPRIATQDYNLAVRYPGLIKDWHPTKNGTLTPMDVLPASHKEAWWKCEKGHEWDARIANRTIIGQTCPYCSNKRVGTDYNLAVRFPAVAKEWHPTKNGNLTPFNFTPGSGRKVWWKCEKGHEWDARIANRATLGRGCPYCSNKLVGTDNNLGVKFPELAKEWHPTKNGNLTARDVVPGSRKKVWWKCKSDHTWEAVIASRARGRGCSTCLAHSRKKNDHIGGQRTIQDWELI